jgi:hypothetical protein
MKKLILIAFSCLAFSIAAQSQTWAVKTNLLYDATTTMNIGAEAALNEHWTLEVTGNGNDAKNSW